MEKQWLDYSSLSTFMTCPRKYYLRHVLNISPIEEHPALVNGKAYHESIAIYYKNRDNLGHDQARALALNHLFESDLKIIKDDPKRNLTTAFNVLSNYFDVWKSETYKTIECEVGFAIDLNDFLYVGKIDRVAESPFGLVIMEHKTTTIMGNRWEKRGKPNLQIDGYVSSYYITTGTMPFGGVIDIIHIHEDQSKMKPPTRIVTARNEHDVERWLKEITHWRDLILNCFHNEYFCMNMDNCQPMLGASCQFYQFCIDNQDMPKEGFVPPEGFKIQEWSPLEDLLDGQI